MEDQLLFSVTETSQTGEARRAALGLARTLGFDQAAAEKVAIVVTETAANLVKHTAGGQLLIQRIQHGERAGIEVLALDRGPGMANVAECLRDGYSTAGSRGEGLGAIRRLSAMFDVHSLPGIGTALLARLWSQPLPRANGQTKLEIGVISQPKRGETVCGDGWTVNWQAERGLILLVDGLGHGPLAAEAAAAAVRSFQANQTQMPGAIFEAIHAALRSTRGAAAAIAEIKYGQSVKFVGVGNIAGTVLGGDRPRHMVSHNGIVGHEARRIQEFSYPWTRGELLILHSDGLGTRWNLDTYPGLQTSHPSLIAGVLWRDFNRGTDDVTVAVVKEAL